MSMRIHKIIRESYVDGPGKRTVLFVQGCSIRCCSGCQNKHLWPCEGGRDLPVEFIAGQLLSTGLPITISGGEPFDQADDLARLLGLIEHEGRHVIFYSGYTFEDLAIYKTTIQPAVEAALRLADVLVDGRYYPRLDSPSMQYRGSSNQRVIDLPATFASGRVVCLDWDTPEIILTEAGDLLGAVPVVALFETVGHLGNARRCGQTH
jgi:anaerobic ribonucleoside-triphosphate reductase activating protein